jgi:hypothetical protein
MSASAASIATPFPSDLSIFSHNDEEIADELGASSSNDSSGEPDSEHSANSPPTPDSANTSSNELAKEAEKRLTQELLDALYLGTGNFLLAYNTRAGIGVLMRVFKLLRQRCVEPV